MKFMRKGMMNPFLFLVILLILIFILLYIIFWAGR